MEIQKDPGMSAAAKAKKVQELMTSKWTTKHNSQSSRAALATNKLQDRRTDFNLVTDEDRLRHYHDSAGTIFGCKHYQRGCKLQAHCCGKWYACRFCHDEISDHNIIRNLTVTMMCMYCTAVQPAGQTCINPQCRKQVSKYYCKECKLWDDDPRKNIYHCYDCGICRIGRGLGIDYFHCKKCNVCMAISLQGRHKCIERNLESDCPICGEYMFTSTTTVIFMPCGHCIHYKCHQEYIQTSYQCPTCFKSLANMTEYFKRVDAMLAQHRMPPEYLQHQSFVYCNDCEKKSYAPFHFLYHKCVHCKGYNTKVLQTFDVKKMLSEKGLITGLAEDGSASGEDALKDPGEVARILDDPSEISKHLNAPILREEERKQEKAVTAASSSSSSASRTPSSDSDNASEQMDRASGSLPTTSPESVSSRSESFAPQTHQARHHPMQQQPPLQHVQRPHAQTPNHLHQHHAHSHYHPQNHIQGVHHMQQFHHHQLQHHTTPTHNSNTSNTSIATSTTRTRTRTSTSLTACLTPFPSTPQPSAPPTAPTPHLHHLSQSPHSFYNPYTAQQQQQQHYFAASSSSAPPRLAVPADRLGRSGPGGVVVVDLVRSGLEFGGGVRRAEIAPPSAARRRRGHGTRRRRRWPYTERRCRGRTGGGLVDASSDGGGEVGASTLSRGWWCPSRTGGDRW
ncbi:hypothetical protein DFJ73DRAFT_767122 [Zopfochytrium polystomum]|nr:hypothetical protein DFJ73DRAFT_767122 [Zopfochytrium polystomum]